MVTNDADFVDALLIRDVPFKRILISTGNISNRELERLLLDVLSDLEAGFEEYRFVELDREALRFHA